MVHIQSQKQFSEQTNRYLQFQVFTISSLYKKQMQYIVNIFFKYLGYNSEGNFCLCFLSTINGETEMRICIFIY